MDGGRADASPVVPRSPQGQARYLRGAGASRARGGGRAAAIRIEGEAIRQARTPEHVRRVFLPSPAHCGALFLRHARVQVELDYSPMPGAESVQIAKLAARPFLPGRRDSRR